MTTPETSTVAARATMAAAVAVVLAVIALLAALASPQLARPALLLLLAVPLVRNAVIALWGTPRERVLAAVGAAMLLGTMAWSLR